MKNIQKIGFIGLLLLLTGQGCLSTTKTGLNTADGALWRTENQGANWTQMATLPQASGVNTIAGVSINSMEIDPTDSSAYYMGSDGNGMFFTLDHGTTWQRPEDEQARTGTVIDIEVDPRDVCTIYALKTDRLLKSTDCSRTFETIYSEGRVKEALTALVLDWFNPDTLWAGTTAGEVLKSIDGGRSWSTVERTKNDVTDIILSNADSRIVLVGTKTSGVYRSADSGATWESLDKNMRRDFNRSGEVYSFAQSRSGGRLVVNSRFGLIESNDNGVSWKEISIIPPPADERIWSIAVNPKDEKILYYGIVGTYYQSTPEGSWMTADLPSTRAPKVIKVHPDGTERVFIGFATLEK